MPDSRNFLLFPKLCRHNRRMPTHVSQISNTHGRLAIPNSSVSVWIVWQSLGHAYRLIATYCVNYNSQNQIQGWCLPFSGAQVALPWPMQSPISIMEDDSKRWGGTVMTREICTDIGRLSRYLRSLPFTGEYQVFTKTKQTEDSKKVCSISGMLITNH